MVYSYKDYVNNKKKNELLMHTNMDESQKKKKIEPNQTQKNIYSIYDSIQMKSRNKPNKSLLWKS